MKSLIKLSHRSGFSLVELIISIGVILTALLGLAGLLGLSIRSNETIRQTTLCKTLATTITETIIVARESEIIDFTKLETVFCWCQCTPTYFSSRPR
ncbi:MAG: prepilin-type N-terminal cleavage/methylation domain-containing protein [Blastocatellia bacterium]|nr:prepilin-type N-terminal cleavage/methylation domain-containing protein [Blastocatellia bacterium]